MVIIITIFITSITDGRNSDPGAGAGLLIVSSIDWGHQIRPDVCKFWAYA